MTKGLIFDIQRFSVNDGPGIRTTVFFKGCSLRCAWCHNPESIASYRQLSYDPSRCDGCSHCANHVGHHGITMIDDKAIVDMNIHDRSYDLVEVCPQGCFQIVGEEKEADEIFSVILKDLDYYRDSGGGVTFSGGEALNQWPFIEALAEKLKTQNIHLTLDVSGYDPNHMIERTFNLIDLYLLDIKAANENVVQKYIRQSLDPDIMLKQLKQANKAVILRCPIIPNVNDDAEYFDLLAQFNETYDNINETHLLPYHKLRKSPQIRWLNDREFFDDPTEVHKERWCQEVRDRGIRNVWMENRQISP